ncbi:TPA: hypothetical protein VGT17_005232 [Vibrio harveyi]|nr:hypothetical protein [Vibrio harveyi]HEQ3599230.1 hypothetical protein [Vibrio harveyi]HEQ3611322.1 hypothetical protein [Vibrio harveyi]
MNYRQLLELVVIPANEELGADSLAAEQLLMGTLAVESKGEYLAQLNDGPARGLFQMEPATHKDIWENYLAYRDTYRRAAISALTVDEENIGVGTDEFYACVANGSLTTDLFYQAIMCRIHYLRVKDPLPPANDIKALAAYWKKFYNTPLGAGTEQKFIDSFPGELWGI